MSQNNIKFLIRALSIIFKNDIAREACKTRPYFDFADILFEICF